MAAITARTIITDALNKLNANAASSEPTDEDIQLGLTALNYYIESKSNEFLNVHTITTQRFLFIPGQYNYLLGPATDEQGNPTGADWVTQRPVRVEKVMLMLNPILTTPISDDDATLFLPISKITQDKWTSIRLRGFTNALPTKLLDNGGFPCRELLFYPVPSDGSKAVEIWMWSPLELYDLDTPLNMPVGYERYYIYGLAIEIADTMSKAITEEIRESFMEAESVIKTLNQIDFTVQPSDSALEMSRNGRPYNYIDFISGSMMLPRERN